MFQVVSYLQRTVSTGQEIQELCCVNWLSSYMSNTMMLNKYLVHVMTIFCRCVELILPVSNLQIYEWTLFRETFRLSMAFHPVRLFAMWMPQLLGSLLNYPAVKDMCCDGKWMKCIPDLFCFQIETVIIFVKCLFDSITNEFQTTAMCCHDYFQLPKSKLEQMLVLTRLGARLHPCCIPKFSVLIQCAIIKSLLEQKAQNIREIKLSERYD